jgi:hypothetical protein
MASRDTFALSAVCACACAYVCVRERERERVTERERESVRERERERERGVCVCVCKRVSVELEEIGVIRMKAGQGRRREIKIFCAVQYVDTVRAYTISRRHRQSKLQTQ